MSDLLSALNSKADFHTPLMSCSVSGLLRRGSVVVVVVGGGGGGGGGGGRSAGDSGDHVDILCHFAALTSVAVT